MCTVRRSNGGVEFMTWGGQGRVLDGVTDSKGGITRRKENVEWMVSKFGPAVLINLADYAT